MLTVCASVIIHFIALLKYITENNFVMGKVPKFMDLECQITFVFYCSMIMWKAPISSAKVLEYRIPYPNIFIAECGESREGKCN